MLACESCGDIISDYGMAWIMWDDAKEREGGTVRPTVLRKGNQCIAKPPYVGFASMEMRDYLVNLFRNLGIRTEEELRGVFEFAELMDSV